MEGRLYAQLRRKERIAKTSHIEVQEGILYDEGLLDEAIGILCSELDLARPVWLNKHSNELRRYSSTRLYESDFVEPFPYRMLELEWVSEKRGTSNKNENSE